MTRIFVSNSPSQLTDSELTEHANQVCRAINGNKAIGLTMLVVGALLAFQTNTFSYYSCLCGLGGGFFMAQGRLAVMRERIKRLEQKLER